MLVEMDGFEALDDVAVVTATNHRDNIDEAMRRPGRFDMLVRLGLPTLPQRQQSFDLYIGKVASDGSADTATLARMSSGMSPSDIANLVNRAALHRGAGAGRTCGRRGLVHHGSADRRHAAVAGVSRVGAHAWSATA